MFASNSDVGTKYTFSNVRYTPFDMLCQYMVVRFYFEIFWLLKLFMLMSMKSFQCKIPTFYVAFSVRYQYFMWPIPDSLLQNKLFKATR